MGTTKKTGKDALLAKSNNTALAMIQKAQANRQEHEAKTTPKKAEERTLPKADKARTRLNLRILTSIREPAEKAARMNQKSLTEVIEDLLREYAVKNADKVQKYDEIFK